MKQHLYTKLLILYFMLGGICFLLLSSGGSYLVEKRLERSTGESLYRTASQLVSKNELRQAVKSPKNESLTLALSSAAAFQNADFWVMDTEDVYKRQVSILASVLSARFRATASASAGFLGEPYSSSP